MFGRSKPKAFKPYALGAKPRRRFPRWLICLMLGVVLGSGGLLYIQQELMAPRLSVEASNQHTIQAARLEAALTQSRGELERVRQELASEQATTAELAANLSKAQGALGPLQTDLALLQEVLPPDPRGGDLQIRAGRFFNTDGGLSYHLVLTRENNARRFRGTVQFVVEGRYSNGRTASLTLDPIRLELGAYENVKGVVELPDGMQARQITIRVLNADGRLQATRVINSRN